MYPGDSFLSASYEFMTISAGILLKSLASMIVSSGILSTVNRVVTREGLPGLFRGNGAQMVRIFPYAATQFASYEQYKVVGALC